VTKNCSGVWAACFGPLTLLSYSTSTVLLGACRQSERERTARQSSDRRRSRAPVEAGTGW